jgi:hypothetical protein
MGALSAITAAVVGVILNPAIWFSIYAIFRQIVPVRGFGLAFDRLCNCDLSFQGGSTANTCRVSCRRRDAVYDRSYLGGRPELFGRFFLMGRQISRSLTLEM